MIAILQSTYSGANDSWSNLLAILGQLFFLIFIFLFVVALAVFCTKWIANLTFLNKYLKKGPSVITVIERIGVSQNASVQLLKVGKVYVLIGITRDKISFLTEVDEEDVIQDTSKQG